MSYSGFHPRLAVCAERECMRHTLFFNHSSCHQPGLNAGEEYVLNVIFHPSDTGVENTTILRLPL